MKLANLLDDPSLPDLTLDGLSEHSGLVEAGDGFIALATDAEIWRQHVEHAKAQGAVAILHDSAFDHPSSLPLVRVADLAALRGRLAARFYGDPSASQQCIGITGTNGKTSIAYHIADVSEQLGVACGYFGTLGWGQLPNLSAGELTTANAVVLQRRLSHLLNQDVGRIAMEVSSHALDQSRAKEVSFDVAVFTNLTRDHLDYHGSLEAYGAAKAKLFRDWPLKTAVINTNDEFGAQLVADCNAQQVITVGARGDISFTVRGNSQGLQVHWQTPWGEAEGLVPVVADFAIGNLALALAALVSLGHSLTDVVDAFSRITNVPGRMELIAPVDGKPKVVVDYAHTPDALSKALAALRPQCPGKLICVVGCGGDRDPGKRPMMGRVAGRSSDLVWLTSDNPRSEDPGQIVADMRAGVSHGCVWECVDRAEAIQRAVQEADANDIVLIAGKGHEDYQEIAGERLPFDDRQIARQALQEAT